MAIKFNTNEYLIESTLILESSVYSHRLRNVIKCPAVWRLLDTSDVWQTRTDRYFSIQSQKAVTAYLKSKQLLHCGFVHQYLYGDQLTFLLISQLLM